MIVYNKPIDKEIINTVLKVYQIVNERNAWLFSSFFFESKRNRMKQTSETIF